MTLVPRLAPLLRTKRKLRRGTTNEGARMNYPRIPLAAVAATLVFFVYGFLVDGMLAAGGNCDRDGLQAHHGGCGMSGAALRIPH